MKHSIIAVCLLTFAFASCNDADKTTTTASSKDTASAAADVKKDAAPKAEPDSATKMKNWMAYSTPGDMHKMMASWNGEWTGEVSMWMDPAAPPEKATIKTQNKMLLGGRYQTSSHAGTMMGMPFEGISTMAYDNAKKQFISTWIDNMGTGLVTMTGTWNESTKTIELKGSMVDPEAGDGSELNSRETMQVIDDQTQLLTMYCDKKGKEVKTMEIRFTRK
ncbi:DUF1579 domain-containing protein [Ferruginibacter sp. HRS2-29]|uniref:DUF1579 domain-containing protein n=1 Tax=Ferruginibacter sp. HRS2-29 TaxID=2487334 RepID=UPI0020CDB224|nr:DUF1579 domain-containing protein [Ferruginibacter sp. HRS2-29]MCP9750115.1 DUF1579 domain-containing protein [Ferruginibacter sp. HRS2-29]